MVVNNKRNGKLSAAGMGGRGEQQFIIITDYIITANKQWFWGKLAHKKKWPSAGIGFSVTTTQGSINLVTDSVSKRHLVVTAGSQDLIFSETQSSEHCKDIIKVIGAFWTSIENEKQ